MSNSYQKHFLQTDNHIWFNAASEGPLSICAREALDIVVEKKSRVHELTIEMFMRAPVELKKNIEKLINVPYRDIILGNSASYGLHILANGIVWHEGDEILLMQNDFPADILPWLALEKKGVIVKQLKPQDRMLSVEELKAAITSKTRLVCLPHVHTFSGCMIDVASFSKVCRGHEVLLVINISQSVGARPVDVTGWDVDAVVSAGYKWICGPYGTGFCWIKPDIRNELDYNHAYWASQSTEDELASEEALVYRDVKSARKYDMFGTANFFNYTPLTTGIGLLLEIGMDEVLKHNDNLNQIFIEQLDQKLYSFISPTDKEKRSSLIVITHKDSTRNAQIHKNLTEAGLHTAFWKNNIRIAPHIFNTDEDIEKLLKHLHQE